MGEEDSDEKCVGNIISELRKGKLRWVGHVERMAAKEGIVKKVFKNTPEGKRSVGKPRMRWLDDVEKCQKKIVVRGWTKK
jgi:hypothetical protein